jgi:hypothetical protein
MDLGHWQFPYEFDVNNWFGFVYRIIERNTGREYVGKKQFWSKRTKAVKGRKNRKHYSKESDWRTYTGSSIELNKAIEINGKDNYIFRIESLHKTRGSLYYREVQVQIFEDVLRVRMSNGIKKYYNGHIAAVKFTPPLDDPDELSMKNDKII